MGYYPSFNKTKEAPAESEYNAAFKKMERIHESWLTARRHWRAGSFDELNYELDYLWIELEADSTKKQRLFISGLNNKIDAVISMRRRYADTRNHVFLSNKLSKLIKTKWKFLFRVEKAQGLGKKYKKHDEDIF